MTVAPRARCGDTVFHRHTGEEWVVAYWDERSGRMAPAGWPECCARIEDCEVTERCTDEQHAKQVALWLSTASADNAGDHRRSKVRELYAAPGAGGAP